MHRLVSLALLLACAGLAAPAWGTIWRCPDPTLGSIFQNEPCTGSGATALPSAEDPSCPDCGRQVLVAQVRVAPQPLPTRVRSAQQASQGGRVQSPLPTRVQSAPTLHHPTHK